MKHETYERQQGDVRQPLRRRPGDRRRIRRGDRRGARQAGRDVAPARRRRDRAPAPAPSRACSPADTRVVVARVTTGGADDLRDAVAAARAAFPAWSARAWQERVAIIERAAEIVRARKFELSVAMILEMGKNRVEALGEIEETADLLAYYAGQMRDERRLRARDGPLGADRPQRERAAPLRRLGGDRPLELPLRAARRAGGGGAAGRATPSSASRRRRRRCRA